jgi:hypothetical protein
MADEHAGRELSLPSQADPLYYDPLTYQEDRFHRKASVLIAE